MVITKNNTTMLRQAIQASRSKIDVFADFASDYLRLRMEYAVIQKPKLTFDDSSKNAENMQLVFTYVLNRQTKEKQLQECAQNLANAFNEVIKTFCEGLRDEHLMDYNSEIFANLQNIFSKFNRMANADVFKGILYIEDANKPLLFEISDKLATYTGNEQLVQLKEQIDALLHLERVENSITEDENIMK